MASYVWPSSLPQAPQDDFSETGGVLILRTQVDAGPAKMRRRGARPKTLSCSFYMTTAQVATLESFVEDTLRGTARFDFTHPRLGSNIEVRLVPQQDGQLFAISFITNGYWNVALEMEVMP
jgi:hypothetical protein